jgi:hypothetical protein
MDVFGLVNLRILVDGGLFGHLRYHLGASRSLRSIGRWK